MKAYELIANPEHWCKDRAASENRRAHRAARSAAASPPCSYSARSRRHPVVREKIVAAERLGCLQP